MQISFLKICSVYVAKFFLEIQNVLYIKRKNAKITPFIITKKLSLILAHRDLIFTSCITSFVIMRGFASLQVSKDKN